ncbi:creatininase family protein [Methylobacterium aerolatum]|uniref:Creatinine amidohydrolase n=1 Tax=Methylobacterium aerolatum TaxID=418708 RepID=A0ABU0HWH2_9HYPH|nr:creatininase family protein [Methylobacterium aerolatum]MDQ0446693.1 creatinine amidohydrolase [Methylobacterium aerolatum]GJD33660.1 Putative mycofactocin system creatinine amidohydrolase family protein MftE [Methylobacterium aerolatum]
MGARNWGDLTTGDLAGAELSRAVAVLPVAATEQHGPHLPLSTDTVIAQGYLDRVAALTPRDLDVLVLPVQTVGKSDEHDTFAGTLSLTAATALAAWTEIGAGIARSGCRRLVVVSSHGGNSALIDLVAGELRGRFGMVAVTTSWARLGVPAGLFPPEEIAHGIHAGGIETALMLALRPDLVRREAVADFPSRGREIARDHAVLRTGRPAALAWKTEDLNITGALGDARLGTAAAGHALLDHGARVFVDLLGEVSRFDLQV